jgi:hypothetical protein
LLELNIPDDWYGPNTARIREIRRRAQAVPWFASVKPDTRSDKVVALVNGYMGALREFTGEAIGPDTLKTVVLEGDWKLLHQDRWGVDPYDPWGDQWKASDEYVGRAIRTLGAMIESNPLARSFLRPPLWPVEMSNVCGEAIIARHENLEAMPRLPPGGRDWVVAWVLLCKANDRVWDALLWELAAGADVVKGRNPFEYLLGLYELGFFPMGWVDDSYELFVPKISMDPRQE